MTSRRLTFVEAIREALDLCLSRDPAVWVMGLGVPDPKGVFGSTTGLAARHGARRVRDMPAAEGGMTGVAIGSALCGMRPVVVHQRMDFALLAVEQIVNQAAKWRYMFGGRRGVPMVVRVIVGRGWGQGAQHSQSLHAWFAHVPGLRVVAPATPADAKGLLVSSVEDDDPVIYVESRWLHGTHGDVPEGLHRVPIGRARVARDGTDVTIVALSTMTLEALRAADRLAEAGVSAEVVDLRTIRPLDEATILGSVRKTGRVVVADTGWTAFGIGAEVVARIAEEAHGGLRAAPRRIGLPPAPSPSTPSLANAYYPRAHDIEAAARALCGLPAPAPPSPSEVPLDVPDPSFRGPF